MNIILDGTGSGKTAKVDSQNRLKTRSDVFSTTETGIVNEAAFTITFCVITLTSCCESALIYFKNNNDSDIVLTCLVIIAGSSTGAPDESFYFNTYLNPTGGTLITDECLAGIVNRNLGSAAVSCVLAYKGGEGKTITGGSMFVGLVHSDRTITNEYPSLAIPKGFSAAYSFTPASGNTNLDISVNLNFYLKDKV